MCVSFGELKGKISSTIPATTSVLFYKRRLQDLFLDGILIMIKIFQVFVTSKCLTVMLLDTFYFLSCNTVANFKDIYLLQALIT